MARTYTRREFLRAVGAGAPLLVALGACAAPASAPAPAAAEPTAGAAEPKAPAPAEAVKITMWGDYTGGPWPALIEAFQSENPGVTVEPLNVPTTPEKLITSVTGGTPPDLFYMDRYLAGEWGARGVILALDDMVNNSAVFKKERLYQRLLDDVTWRGKIWAIPSHTDCRAFWWNKDIYAAKGLDPEKPPTTWAELEQYSDEIYERDANEKIALLGFSPTAGNPPGFLQFWIYLWQLGGEYLSSDQNTAIFNSEAGVEALTWMVKMTDKYGGIDEISEFLQPPGVGPGMDVFNLGVLGQMINGNWQIANYGRYTPDLKYGLATFPLPPNGQAVNYIGGWTYVIPKGVKHEDVSWKFVEFLMQDDECMQLIDYGGHVPPYEDIAMSDTWQKGDPNKKLFAEEVKNGRWVPVTPGVAEMFSIQIRLLDEALHHLKEPKQALDEAVAAVQEVLDTNKPLREG
jgi:multiple sugar transport system substrate-binding protein